MNLHAKFDSVLLQLSRLDCIDGGNVHQALQSITETICKSLLVARVSIWFTNPEQTAIVCQDLFQEEDKSHSNGAVLDAKMFPAYFEFLSEQRVVAADNARLHPATSEFSDVYLKPLNIVSMLDAPIRIDGKLAGVVCCEHTGSRRYWTESEQAFVGNVGDIIARAIQAQQRHKAFKDLEDINNHLEKLVKERTSELEDQRLRSAHSSKMAVLGEMAGSIAHEINNPLAIIVSAANIMKLMQSRGDLTPQTQAKLLGDITDTCFRIEKIVKGLRFFARDASMDKMELTSVSRIVEDTLNLCRQKMIINGCKLEVSVESTGKIVCQPVSISQALLNLISNSTDAMENMDDKWIRIECREDDQHISLRVVDAGCGIDPELKPKIMQAFFTTKPVAKGTGLGLAIVKRIVEEHQGTFFLDESSTNTCFEMRFPKAG